VRRERACRLGRTARASRDGNRLRASRGSRAPHFASAHVSRTRSNGRVLRGRGTNDYARFGGPVAHRLPRPHRLHEQTTPGWAVDQATCRSVYVFCSASCRRSGTRLGNVARPPRRRRLPSETPPSRLSSRPPNGSAGSYMKSSREFRDAWSVMGEHPTATVRNISDAISDGVTPTGPAPAEGGGAADTSPASSAARIEAPLPLALTIIETSQVLRLVPAPFAPWSRPGSSRGTVAVTPSASAVPRY
jgi:hypothetical protein